MTIKKGLVLIVVLLAAILAACILVYQMLTSGRVQPIGLLLLAAVISILLPMARTHFFPSAADCKTELAFHVQRQDTFVRQLIEDKLGPDALQQMATAMGADDKLFDGYVRNLLEKAGKQRDMQLRFALLTIRSRHYEQAGDPAAAAASLAEALQSHPQDFVTRFRLAENLEWQGDAPGALDVYRGILETPADLSRAMIKLTRRQIELLQKR